MTRHLLLALIVGATTTLGCHSSTSKGSKEDMAEAPMEDMAKTTNVDMASGNSDGGDGGGMAMSPSHNGVAIMAGAVKASSAHYKIIMSLGQGPGDNHTTSSTSQRVNGGLVGATQPGKP